MKYAWVDGRIVRADRAVVPMLDRAVQYGYGLFETLRLYGGRPFLLKAHMRRLARSARHLRIRLPNRWRALEGGIQRLAEANGNPDAALRIVVTAGPPPIVMAHARPLALPNHPVRVWIDPETTKSPGRLAGHKTLNYLENYLARDRKPEWAYEVLFRDANGAIVEGAVSNLFIVKRGRVRTPPVKAILPGITRTEVIRILGRLKIPFEEARVTGRDLRGADESFLTNSLIEVAPIRPGPVTRAIAREYAKRVVRAGIP